MDLTPQALLAFDTVVRTARNLRIEVKKGCRDERFRMRLFYEVVDPATGAAAERSVGLVWHEDGAALRELRGRLLERATAARAVP